MSSELEQLRRDRDEASQKCGQLRMDVDYYRTGIQTIIFILEKDGSARVVLELARQMLKQDAK